MKETIELLYLRRNPFIRLLIPFVVGGLFATYSSAPLEISIITLLFLLLVVIFLFFNQSVQKDYRYNYFFGVSIVVFLMAFGYSYTSFRLQLNRPVYFNKIQTNTMFEGVVNENLTEKERSFVTTIRLTKLHNSHTSINTSGKVMCYLSKEEVGHLPQIGDVILFKAQLETINAPKLPQEFNYKSYLEQKGIFHSVYIPKDNFSIIGTTRSLYIIAQKIRTYLIQKLGRTSLNSDELSIVSALFLGEKKHLDNTIKSQFATIGAMHVLAVSGLHVGILLAIITFVLNKIIGKEKHSKIKVITTVLLIWTFAFITGLTPSILRAATMFSIIIIGKLLLERVTVYNAIAASAFILLVINPFYLFDVGFQLSYAAVLSIVYFYPKIYNLFYIKNRIINKLWSLTAVSIAAQIATIPISVYYFHQIPLLTLFSNVFVTFFAVLIIAVGVLMLCLLPFEVALNTVSIALSFIIQSLLKIVSYTARIPFAKVENLSLTKWELALCFTSVILLILSIETKRLKWLNYALGIVLLLTIHKHIYDYNINRHQEITFLNTDQEQTAFNITSKYNNKLCCSDTNARNKERLVRSLSNFWVTKTKQKPRFTEIDASENLVVAVNNIKILLLNNSDIPNLNSWFEFVVLNTLDVKFEQLKQRINCNKLVLGSVYSNSKLKVLENQNRYNGFNVYSSANNPSFSIAKQK